MGSPPALDLGPLSVLVLRHVSDSSSFRYQASTDWKHANLKTQKSKSENYWLQLVPLPAVLRPPPPLSPTATQPWSSPCSVWRPLVVTTLTIRAWWNSDLLFMIKSAWLDVILTASFICLSRQLWKLPTTSIEKSCFSPLCASLLLGGIQLWSLSLRAGPPKFALRPFEQC